MRAHAHAEQLCRMYVCVQTFATNLFKLPFPMVRCHHRPTSFIGGVSSQSSWAASTLVIPSSPSMVSSLSTQSVSEEDPGKHRSCKGASFTESIAVAFPSSVDVIDSWCVAARWMQSCCKLARSVTSDSLEKEDAFSMLKWWRGRLCSAGKFRKKLLSRLAE